MLNESQKIAVQHTVGPMLILAGAGAGKTHTLTERVAISSAKEPKNSAP